MPYLGTGPIYGDLPVKTFTGDGSATTFTLDHSVPSDASIIVSIDGVRQHVGSYNAAGGTTLDFLSVAPASGTSIEVVHLGIEASLNTPADSSVTAAKLSTSGTPDGTKYLRDDLAWSTVPAGSPTGGGSDKIFFQNGSTVSTSYAVTTNDNAGSFGPITVSAGATVTLSGTSEWTII